ncbi:MAG TPA: hypothetical protein VM344_01030, partial [Vitreimonas sp.]|nr:hypothetical protein [Vitreimonas sp.]
MTVFDRLGRLVVRRHRAVIIAWVVLLALALPLAPRVLDALRPGGFTLDDLESARARQLLLDELGLPPSALVVVLHSEEWPAGSPEFEAAAARATAGLAAGSPVAGYLSHVVAPRQVSEDRRTAYDVVLLDLAPDESPAAVPLLASRLTEVPGLEVALAGGPAFYGDVQRVT